MKKVISLFLVMAMMLAIFTVSFNASFSVSDKDDDGNPIIWSAKDAIAAYEQEYGEEVVTKRIYFQMPNGKRGASATADHSVTITDYAPMTDPETGEILVDPEGNPIMEAVGSHDEVVIHEGEKAPTWYNDYNVLDGHTYAACYWWGGTADPQHFTTLTDGTTVGVDWCGYRAEIADEEQGIYYIDLPDDVATIIWNNGVNGGMDSSLPIYYLAAQTGNLNAEGAYPDEYDTIPYGSPDPWYFDNCIYVIDPDSVDVNPLTNKQTCGGNWYIYYGDGCYGSEFAEGYGDDTEYPDGTPGWSEDMQDVCLNVNFPEVARLAGMRICRMGRGRWVQEWISANNPRGMNAFWLTGRFLNLEPHSECTDYWALDHGYGAITPIKLDMTAYEVFDKLTILGNPRES